jgi:hypothetical protein
MAGSPPLFSLSRTYALDGFGRYLLHSRSLQTHSSSSWQFAILAPPESPQVIMRFVFPIVMIPFFIGAPREKSAPALDSLLFLDSRRMQEIAPHNEGRWGNVLSRVEALLC